MIQLKSPDQIELMRAAGLVVAEALAAVRAAVAPGVRVLELDRIAEDLIRERGGVPSFLNYLPGLGYLPPDRAPAAGAFLHSICASVNDVVVHGIPDDRVLRDGDVISIDCGAILEGWHGDAAVTVPVGEVSPEVIAMIEACEQSLWAGIAAMHAGGRLRDVGTAIENNIRATGSYGILTDYGGHGIGTEMHQDPHVLNYRTRQRGPKLVNGMCLAIEPMITLGKPKTHLLADNWAVATDDGSLSAHAEHSVAITPDGPWVLTAPDGGAERLGQLGVATPA